MYSSGVIKAEKTYNVIKKALLIFIACLLVVSVFTSIFANAEIEKVTDDSGVTTYTINSTSYSTAECTSPFGKFALWLVYVSYGGLFSGLDNSNFFLIDGYDPDNTTNALWSTFWSGYDVMALLGTCLALMWTLLTIIERAADGRVNTEFIIMMAMKFLACMFICLCGKDAAATLIGLSNNLTTAIQNAMTNAASSAEDAADGATTAMSGLDKEAANRMAAIVDGHIFTALAYLIECIVPAFAMLACYVIAIVQLIARLFELGIRTVFFPIGVADFMSHGINSPGMQYMKQYLGCACQGVAMYIVMITGITMMQQNSLSAIFGDDSPLANSSIIITQIVIAIVMVGVMKKAGDMIRDAFR